MSVNVNTSRECHFAKVYGDEMDPCNGVSKRVVGRYDGRPFTFTPTGLKSDAERVTETVLPLCGKHSGRQAEEMGAHWTSRLTEFREYLRRSTEKRQPVVSE